MTQLIQSSVFLWASYLVLAVGISSAISLSIWCARQIWREESLPSSSGDCDALPEIPPKKLTAAQIAQGMLLLAALLLAYDRGTKAEYSKEFAAWKVRQAQFEKEHAAWLARHSKEMTNGQSQQISLAR